MADVIREKYMKLMGEIEDLEDKVEALEAANADQSELQAAQEELGAKRHELQRLSDGCGPGRSQA